jgi:hypothetical protein
MVFAMTRGNVDNFHGLPEELPASSAISFRSPLLNKESDQAPILSVGTRVPTEANVLIRLKQLCQIDLLRT